MFKTYKLIRKFRKFYSDGNTIIVISPDGRETVNPKTVKKLRVSATGTKNKIVLYEPFKFSHKLRISLSSNAEIVIKPNCNLCGGCNIIKMRGEEPNFLHIGKNFGCGANATFDITDHGNITIGDNCMFSWNIYFKSDDTHPVISTTDGAVLNKSDEIVVGDNVWIGMNASILKNSRIPSHCIVGAYSVVAKRFDMENCALAGNPARVVKTDVDWRPTSISDYVASQQNL